MAQPITKWQAFQSYYARENPGSSKQQASVAWSKYKEIHGIVLKTSPKREVKKSPAKNSPAKNSPAKKSLSNPRSPPKTEMHKLVRATLTGLPPDISRIIAGQLPGKSIAGLQATSKRTKAITQQELERICKEMPTKGEIAAYVKDRLAMPTGSMEFLTLPDMGEEVQESVILNAFSMKEDIIEHLLSSKDGSELNIIGGYAVISKPDVLTRVNTLADPTTMFNVLKRRTSCHKTDGHNVWLVLEYVKNILRPLLAPILSVDQIEEVLSGKVPEITAPLPPFDNVVVDNPRYSYVSALYLLNIVVKWMTKDLDMTLGRIINPQRDIEVVTHRNSYIERIAAFFRDDGFLRIATTQPIPIYPTTTEILEYMQKKLKSGENARVAFYSHKPMHSFEPRLISIHIVREFIISEGNITLETRDFTPLSRHSPPEAPYIREIGEPALETFNDMVKRKNLPGLVDIKTMHAIIKEKGIFTPPKHHANYVAKQLRDLFLSVIATATNVIGWHDDGGNTDNRLFRGEYTALTSTNAKGLPAFGIYLLLIARWNGSPLVDLEAKPFTIKDALDANKMKKIMETLL